MGLVQFVHPMEFGDPTATQKQSGDPTAGRSLFLAPTLEKKPSVGPLKLPPMINAYFYNVLLAKNTYIIAHS